MSAKSFKVALRSFRNNKFFSILNILGLALGLACSLLILLWVGDERNVDAFHTNKTTLYSLYEREFADGKITADYNTPALLGDELKKDIPEIKLSASSDWNDNYTFRTNDKTLKQVGGYGGKDFFNIFSFPLLEGNAATALSGPADIAISKKMAVTFFGSPHAAIGQTLSRDSANTWKELKVSAVFEDIPANSSYQFDFLINWFAYYKENPWMKRWDNSGPLTTIVIRPDADPAKVSAKIRNFLDKFASTTPGHRTELGIQLFDEMYLHSNFRNGEVSGGRIEYVRLFSIVAIFIILIACINFMNLTTARSVKRAKEIGVRKVIGALRGNLILQFFGEAITIACCATALALLLVYLTLPLFNNITGKHILLPTTNIGFWLQLVLLTLLTGLISGSYPALFLSSFQPKAILKGIMKVGAGATLLRKGLVVFQFVLSIVLIIGTIVITRQVNFIQTISLGYNREHLLYIPLDGELNKKYELFKEQALQLPGIQSITCSSESPTTIDNGTTNIDWDGKPADSQPSFTQVAAGYDLVSTLRLQLIQGRDFSKAYPTDSVGYIINETAAKKIGYKDPIGRRLTFWGRKGTIIGLVKDFHFNSLHDPVKPLIFRFSNNISWANILVRTEPGTTEQALTSLKGLCKKLNPAFPFTYQFSDEEYQKLYKSETVIGKLSNYFAFLAIFISCLGLLGLAMFTAEQRTKEIGIRKVLGANNGQLFTLLSKDFLFLVGLAFAIAAPLAWWAMSRWLEDYAYHTSISANIFLIAGLLATVIALITVSFHAIRVAIANPVKSLRAE